MTQNHFNYCQLIFNYFSLRGNSVAYGCRPFCIKQTINAFLTFIKRTQFTYHLTLPQRINFRTKRPNNQTE